MRKSKGVCVSDLTKAKTCEEEGQIVNQWMASLKTELAKPKASKSPVYKDVI
jgi:hypothetical protein